MTCHHKWFVFLEKTLSGPGVLGEVVVGGVGR